MERRILRAEVPGWALVAAAVIAVWGLLSIDGANEPTDPPAPERVQYLTDADRELLEEVVAAMSTTTMSLPPDQAAAVEHAREALEAVTTGEVVVVPTPDATPAPTVPATTTTQTTVPATTTTTDRVRHLIPPPTVTVP